MCVLRPPGPSRGDSVGGGVSHRTENTFFSTDWPRTRHFAKNNNASPHPGMDKSEGGEKKAAERALWSPQRSARPHEHMRVRVPSGFVTGEGVESLPAARQLFRRRCGDSRRDCRYWALMTDIVDVRVYL